MNSFPLLRKKWSNERLMEAVLLALALYMLPDWVKYPAHIWEFMAILAFGLALDAAASFVRYKKPVCAVSAAVTVAILQALAPGVPLWGRLIAAALALLAGKHAWGGTGKNPVNPAMAGLLFLSLFFYVKFPAFDPTLLLVPAVMLSLPFFIFRPFAAGGMMVGMSISLLLHQGLTPGGMLAYGVVFWGCMVITDPVTTTAQPLAGALAGLLAGFVPLYFSGSAFSMALGVLAANMISIVADRLATGSGIRVRLAFSGKEHIRFSYENTVLHDLTGMAALPDGSVQGWTSEGILERIERNKVFGFGGAAFPTIRKIRAAIEANAAEKHLVVNGVECDPGLIHDKWLLRRHAGEIEQGIRLLALCIPFSSITVAVKDAEGLAFPKDIAIHRVPDYYPAGSEKILIKEVLKKTLSHDTVPAMEGILVLNAQTVFSIFEAVCLDRKADTRFITVANINEMSGQVARVRLGTGAHDIVKKVYPGSSCVFSGGGMMNARVAADEAVVDEAVNFLAVGKYPDYRESPLCSRCGLCSAVCPARLQVKEIARLVDEGRMDRTAELHPERCMACGSCSHVCLAGRNLAARMSAAKASLKKAVS